MGEESIEIAPNGPYLVPRGIPLVRRQAVVTEAGEPIAWRGRETLDAGNGYALCRCGGSARKPFCDGTHAGNGFDGTETADTGPIAARAKEYAGVGIVVQDDRSICEHAGFCGNRVTNVWKMVADSADTQVRSHMIAMIERCPSGALSYSLDESGAVEPELPRRIAAVVDGPLWVTGRIPVRTSTGELLETRNRVTLCRCGASANKPHCDGTHKKVGFTDPPSGPPGDA